MCQSIDRGENRISGDRPHRVISAHTAATFSVDVATFLGPPRKPPHEPDVRVRIARSSRWLPDAIVDLGRLDLRARFSSSFQTSV